MLSGVADRYAVAVTARMAELIDTTDPADPIALQFIPDTRELIHTTEESADPIGDDAHSPVKGLVHRYPDRVLLKLTHTCPVYCRFCFRREMVGNVERPTLSRAEIDAAIAYIAARPAIREVIMTGGDPFIVSPRRLAHVTAGLRNIGHVDILRWHTRVPVVEPARITSELIGAIFDRTKAVYVGIHCNHPRELTPEARSAIGRLAHAGIGLVSQTVLLKGVNDDPAVLADLFHAFVTLKVRPYYLHHLDAAPGTSHFRVPLERGQAIMQVLRGRISGLALPTYVLDIPGGHGKVPVGPRHIRTTSDGRMEVVDVNGQSHHYRSD
jgi:lysine 2,3-aminomutase